MVLNINLFSASRSTKKKKKKITFEPCLNLIIFWYKNKNFKTLTDLECYIKQK